MERDEDQQTVRSESMQASEVPSAPDRCIEELNRRVGPAGRRAVIEEEQKTGARQDNEAREREAPETERVPDPEVFAQGHPREEVPGQLLEHGVYPTPAGFRNAPGTSKPAPRPRCTRTTPPSLSTANRRSGRGAGPVSTWPELLKRLP